MINVIMGIIFVLLGVFGITYFWWDVLIILRGLFPVLFLITGGVAIVAGLELMKGRPGKNIEEEEEDSEEEDEDE